MMKDKRPDPRPRKHAALWQSYLWWNELVEMRKRHNLRISSIDRGKSNLDAQLEKDMMELMDLDGLIKMSLKNMTLFGEAVGPVWDWLTSIKGLGAGGLAAQLLAMIDYPAPLNLPNAYPDHCATISKLWRYAGWACMDGEIDRPTKGEKIPYNKRLKSVVWLIVDQFIKQQTPLYAEHYYAEKERQRRLHPEIVCRECGCVWADCTKKKAHVKKKIFTPKHIHNRAIRKTAKLFLSHLWVVWRESEGLPVSEPWIVGEGGHHNIIPPPNWG